jgi:tetratricopeptide (TPR) repeat protein
MAVVARGVGDLRRLHPHPPASSTFFFTGVPSFAGIQVADGPLVRGVYRDSSLRSYYLTDLNRERMARGPSWFMFYAPDSGHFRDESSDPDLFLRVALGHLLNGREDSAREAMAIGRSRGNVSRASNYLAGFMALDEGDRATASRCFADAGCREAANGDDVLRRADQMTAAGDTTAALELLANALPAFVLDQRLHARVTDLKLTMWKGAATAALEAYAQRVLAPRDGVSWRRWAYALYWQSRFSQARDALEQYYRLSPEIANHDPDALEMRRLLPRMMPGGDILQRSLLREASR